MKILALLSICMLLLDKESTQHDEQLFPTKLRITVIDGLGNYVEGDTVIIYEEEEGYRSNQKATDTLITDDKGVVLFKEDLNPVPYYIQATLGDKNNDGEGVKTEALSKGKINRVNTVIE